MFQRSLVVALCCLASVALKAQAGAQLRKRVDWNLRTSDFREALRSFETLTGVYFQYDASLTPDKKTYDIRYQDQIASVALRDFLHRYGLDYSLVMDQALVLKPWKPIDYSLRVSGSLTNAITGERIVGASIVMEREGRAVYSNSQGIFHVRSTDSVQLLGI